MNMLEDIEVERAEVEQAKSLLETVNKELEAFSYSVSHDLRAPLRAISGFAEAIREDYAPPDAEGKPLDAEGKRYLGLIQDNAHKMGQLIDDLLAFSRLGRQQMSDTRIDMAALAKAVFDELAALTPSRRLALRMGSVPLAQGDGTLLRQVLANLLSNAIKFTKTKAQASIEFGYLRDAALEKRGLFPFPRRAARTTSRTTAWGLICGTWASSSGSSSGCTPLRSSRARAWALHWCSGLSRGTGGGCGRRARWTRERSSTLPCRQERPSERRGS